MNRLGNPPPERVAVLRALQLGDMLCAVPALRALRAALPEARITLIGLPWAREFVDRFHHYVDSFLEFPGFPGIPEAPFNAERLPDFLRDAHTQAFDLALQMHGSGEASNPFTLLLGARHTAGYCLPDRFCPDRERFLTYPDHEPEVRRHLRLLEFLGVPAQGEALEFPIRREDEDGLQAALGDDLLRPGEYICVHPGSRRASRRWPAGHFAAVADALAAQGFGVVITGTASERDAALAVANAMSAPALDLAGRTRLGEIAALLRDARLVITNDTGVSHLAAAVRAPSVVVFLASDPNRWAPLDRLRHRVIFAPEPDSPSGVTPQAVLAAAMEQMGWANVTQVEAARVRT